MKQQIYSKLAMALGLMLMGHPSFSTQTIYGLQNASQFKSNSSKDVYIQLGSFKNKAYASQLRATMQAKTSYPILVKEKNSYFIVLMGPIHSASLVRTTAQKMVKPLAGSRVAKTTPRLANTKKRISRSQSVKIPSPISKKLTRKVPKLTINIDKKGRKQKNSLPVPASNRTTVNLEGVKRADLSTNPKNFASADLIGLPAGQHAGDGIKSSGQYSLHADYQSGRAKWLKLADNKSNVTPAPNNTNSPDYQTVQALYNTRKYQEAIDRAKQYLATHPDDLKMHYLLAQAYSEQEKYALSREELNFILQKNPRLIQERLTLIEVDAAMLDFAQAISVADEGLKLFPNNTDLLEAKNSVMATMNPNTSASEYEKLKEMYSHGEKEEAIVRALNYLHKKPDDAHVRFMLAQLYFQEKNYPAAREQLKLTLQKEPGNNNARVMLINVDTAIHDYTEAMKAADLTEKNKTLGLSPINPNLKTEETIYASGNLSSPQGLLLKKMYSEGNHTQAINAAKSYLEKNPDDGDIRLLLAQFYLQEKNYPAAREQLKLTLQTTPNYTEARVLLINVELAMHNQPEAMTVANQGLKLSPNDPDLLKAKKNINESEQSNVSTITFEQRKNTFGQGQTTGISSPQEYSRLKKIYAEGKHRQAINEAKTYLLKNPDDGDVRLALAGFYLKDKNYPAAKEQLKLALNTTPTYLEVRLLLINVDLATHDYKQAMVVAEQGLKLSPNNNKLLEAKKNIVVAQTPVPKASIYGKSSMEEYKILQKMYSAGKRQQAIDRALNYLQTNPDDGDVRLALGQFYFDQKQYSLARAQFYLALNKTPTYTGVRIQLVNLDIATNRYAEAKRLLADGRMLQPNNLELYSLEGTLAFEEARFPRAADIARRVLAKQPNNESALELKENLDGITPRYMIGRNSVGIVQQGVYVSDQHQGWDYTTLYYGYDTDYGVVYSKVNYNSRFLKGASQVEIDAWPILNKYVYFNVDAGYANEPVLFPRYMVGAEAYVEVPKLAAFSLGGKYNRVLDNKAYSFYTGSITKEFYNNLLTFRPYYYRTSPGPSSLLYTGTFQHFFRGDRDNYINLNVQTGRSPDLFDLASPNFITTTIKGVNLDYVFPIFNHSVVIDLGVGYLQQKFPEDRPTRNLTSGTISIEKRFD
jgi:YaiO family outer membrane protein